MVKWKASWKSFLLKVKSVAKCNLGKVWVEPILASSLSGLPCSMGSHTWFCKAYFRLQAVSLLVEILWWWMRRRMHNCATLSVPASWEALSSLAWKSIVNSLDLHSSSKRETACQLCETQCSLPWVPFVLVVCFRFLRPKNLTPSGFLKNSDLRSKKPKPSGCQILLSILITDWVHCNTFMSYDF